MKTFQENFELIYPDDRAGAFQSFLYDERLCDIKTKHQHIQIFQTNALGKVLVLDGVVQCTEMDEFIYHEMLVHVPMFSAEPPNKRALIIGGGDGGSLREVLKHKDVHHVTVCEIDRHVITTGIDFFGAGEAFNDPRVEVEHEDAAYYLRRCPFKFDVIIVDSTDPTTTGGKSLFTRNFANALTGHLNEDGSISIMAGVPMAQGLDHMKPINEMMKFNGYRPHLYTTTVPTYYGGLTSMYLYQKPCRPIVTIDTDLGFKHYNVDIHEAAFVLPNWLKEMENEDK